MSNTPNMNRDCETPDNSLPTANRGAALLAFVLILAFVGVLIGFGRLKAHKYAVIQRLDRTYQIEKMLATRDVLALANSALPIGAVSTDSDFQEYYYDCPSLNAAGPNNLRVGIEYIPDRDRQDMDDANEWEVFSNDPKEAYASPKGDGNVALFAPISTNFHYRVAIAKRAESCWQDCEFGYLYGLRMHEGASDYNCGTVKLYLVGVAGTSWSKENRVSSICDGFGGYLGLLEGCNWYRMDITLGERGDDISVIRDLTIQVKNNNDVRPRNVFSECNIIRTGMDDTDSFSHTGGFLLASSAFCGFGSNADDELLFSKRWDISYKPVEMDDTDSFLKSFKDSIIVIEHEFPTNSPPADLPRREVTIDSFVMREPATYAASVCNKALENKDFEGKIATWIFQTAKPTKGKIGKQCILDTFGREPTSYLGERKGIIPK